MVSSSTINSAVLPPAISPALLAHQPIPISVFHASSATTSTQQFLPAASQSVSSATQRRPAPSEKAATPLQSAFNALLLIVFTAMEVLPRCVSVVSMGISNLETFVRSVLRVVGNAIVNKTVFLVLKVFFLRFLTKLRLSFIVYLANSLVKHVDHKLINAYLVKMVIP